ncbi:MAG: FAD-dependent oxidoreductase [Chthoniobacteraceae bacterium]
MSEGLNFDVVIAGGGFAGVYCAQALSRKLGPEARERVAVIADQNFMLFQPMLAEVAGSSISPQHVVNPIRQLVKHCTVLRAKISEIDYPGRKLILKAGNFTSEVIVTFDHLVLAVGGIVDLSRTPGMPEHAYLMKTVGDAGLLRTGLLDRFEEANLETDPVKRRKLLSIVIVGGGFSGVETAGELLDLIRSLKRFYPAIKDDEPQVTLIHGREHLLPEVSESLGVYCEKNLTARGMKLIMNARVTSMTASKIQLADGRIIESSLVVSTVGNAPHPLVLDLIAKNKFENSRSRILTDETMLVKGQENLWAAGDCAGVPLAGGKVVDGKAELCPPTAQFAYRQGQTLGKNLAAMLKAKMTGAPKPKPAKFTFKGLGELAAIGHQSAVAEIMGVKFSGILAWLMWRTIYTMKLPGIEKKLRVVIDWTLDLFFPRDITLFNTQATNVLTEVHLEKDDVIFHPGEPALSFYMVKQGKIDLLDENGLVKSLGPGEHFGERALLNDKIWRFKAVAAETSTLVSLNGEAFHTISSASESIRAFFQHSAAQYTTREQIERMLSGLADSVRALNAAQVMKVPLTVTSDLTVQNAMDLLVEHSYTSLPLIDPEGKPLGLINQNRLFDAIEAGEVVGSTLLKDFPPLTFATVLPSTPVPEVVERFCRSGRRKLLVVDASGKLAGVVTPVDLMSRSASPQIETPPVATS